MFSDRRNPTATRMHFALASMEDAILQDVEAAILESADAKINVYMFDGAIATVREGDMESLEQSLSQVGNKWHVNFKIERFSA